MHSSRATYINHLTNQSVLHRSLKGKCRSLSATSCVINERRTMSLSRILCGRNFIGSNLNIHGCSLGRTLCKQPPEQSTESSQQPENGRRSDYPEYSDYPEPVGLNSSSSEDDMAKYMKLRKQEFEKAKPYETMPKLPMIPIFGSAWMYFPIIGKYSSSNMYKADILKQKKYGDIVREKFGFFEVVSSYHPMTNRVLQVHEGRFPARAEFLSLKKYRKARPEWYQPLGLVAMQGPDWEEFRLKVRPYTFQRNVYNDIIGDVAGDLVKLIKVTRDRKAEVTDLMELMSRWALESISCITLDTRLGCLDPNMGSESDGMRMIKSVRTQLACMNKMEASSGNFPFFKYFPTPTWRQFVKEADVFTSLVFKYIKMTLDDYMKNRDKAKETTILQKMLMDEKLNVSGAMVAVADLIMAGIDTTAHTAGYFLYNLARNPEKQEALYKVLKTWPEKQGDDETDVPPYYEYCMEESLRLTPAVRGNLRIFDHDVVVHGYRVPAGVAVLCVQQVFARDERFFENPDDFIPERYMGKDKSTFKLFKPFGIGKRSCIGQPLARKEIYALIKQVLQNYRMEYHYEEIKLKTRLLNVPDRAIKVKFMEREDDLK